jgi:hypothetical protein
MSPSRIIAGLLAGLITASLFALPMLGHGFQEPMIVKVFYFFVIDHSEQEK